MRPGRSNRHKLGSSRRYRHVLALLRLADYTERLKAKIISRKIRSMQVEVNETRALLNLSRNVSLYRCERGWSKSELARRAGVPRMQITRLEEGMMTSLPGTALVLRLADAFEESVDSLLGTPKRKKSPKFAKSGL